MLRVSPSTPTERKKRPPLLVEEVTPAPSAWLAYQKIASWPFGLFFDSAAEVEQLGRYSFVTADPFCWIVARGKSVFVDGERIGASDPFEVVRERLAPFRQEKINDLPPFQAGAAGLFGYELSRHLERLPRARFDDFELPDLAVGIYDWVLSFDHQSGRAWLVSSGFPETGERDRLRRAKRRRDAVLRLLEGPLPKLIKSTGACRSVEAPQRYVPGLPLVTSTHSREEYLATIRRAIDYVHAGDCFQVNVAQRLLSPLTVPPLELYGRLRQRNAAPFATCFDLGDGFVASSSPERFLLVNGRRVETRPIKGTRARAVHPRHDMAQQLELLESPKDRAENVMIVDLLRNDLGRVCRFGSIDVPRVCRLETYRYVHHLVSEVVGELRPGLDRIDLLKATFPGGSITGAPKIRAMEIIAELEPTVRGPYCGSMAYLSFDGSMDSNLLIRTMIAKDGWVQYPVGGGIVADSNPEREYEETWHKAWGLLEALR